MAPQDPHLGGGQSLHDGAANEWNFFENIFLNSPVITVKKEKVKEADLYSAFIEVPYTQGALGTVWRNLEGPRQ